MQSKGAVRRVIEEEGTLLISFHRHAGYFRIPKSGAMLKERILKARQDREEISFHFDRDLTILSIEP